MLFIIAPRSYVLGAVGMRIGTVAVSFVVDPFALVNIAVRVVELTLPVGLSVAPLAVVARSVQPFLLSVAVAHSIQPLTLVDGSAIQVDGGPELPHIFGEVLLAINGRGAARAEVRLVIVVRAVVRRNVRRHTEVCAAGYAVKLVRPHGFAHLGSVDAADSILRCIFAGAVGKEAGAVSHFNSNY